MTVTFTDSVNRRHEVTIFETEEVTLVFPIFAGEWVWYAGTEHNRTGFNKSVNWVKANFRYEGSTWFRDPSIRITS